MKPSRVLLLCLICACSVVGQPPARNYVVDTTVPAADDPPWTLEQQFGTGGTTVSPGSPIRCQIVNLRTAGGAFYGQTLLRASFFSTTAQAPAVTFQFHVRDAADGSLLAKTQIGTTTNGNALQSADFDLTQADPNLGNPYLTATSNVFLCLEWKSGSRVDLVQDSSATKVPTWTSSPPNPANDNGNKAPANIFLVGVPHAIFNFPYLETFDTWTPCGEVCWHSLTGLGEACPVPFGWHNVPTAAALPQSDTNDWVEWFTHAGQTRSRTDGNLPTGPITDHTTEGDTGLGQYLYTEASEGCADDEFEGKALLESPSIILRTRWRATVTFWYHMYGNSGMSLHVDVWDGTAWILDFGGVVDLSSAVTGTPGAPDPGVDAWREWDPIDLSFFAGKGPFKLRWRGVMGTAAKGIPDKHAESDMAIDDLFFDAAPLTDTPDATLSPTPTPTGTGTPTMTTIPTYTVIRTQTSTPTATDTPLRAYIHLGIPDANRDIVTAQWSHLRPGTFYQDEWFSITMSGLWLGGVDEPIYVKLAYWKASCILSAPGMHYESVVTPGNNTAIFKVPELGEFMLCIKHRLDWEQVRNDIVTIIPKPTVDLDGTACNVHTAEPACTAALDCKWNGDTGTCWGVRDIYFGFNNCGGISVSVPDSCGCWYQRGDASTKTMVLPYEYPTRLLTRGDTPRMVVQGCCTRAHGSMTKFYAPDLARGDGLADSWGYCVENPVEQLPVL